VFSKSPLQNVFIQNDQYIFQSIANVHLKLLQEHAFSIVPFSFPYSQKSSLHQDAVLENIAFETHHFRQVRLLMFTSRDKQIFQSVWYPRTNAPILTTDFIHFGNNKSVFLVNLIETDRQESSLSSLFEMKKKYPEFSTSINTFFHPFRSFIGKAHMYASLRNDTTLAFLQEQVLPLYIKEYMKICQTESAWIILTDKGENKQKEYNRIRQVIDSSSLLYDYFDAEWLNGLFNSVYDKQF
jgi:hypothetical protein